MIAAEEIVFFDDKAGNLEFPGDVEHTGAGFITNNEGNRYSLRSGKMLQDAPGIGTRPAGKDGYPVWLCAFLTPDLIPDFPDIRPEEPELPQGDADEQNTERPQKRDEKNVKYDPGKTLLEPRQQEDPAAGIAAQTAAQRKRADDQQEVEAVDFPAGFQFVEHGAKVIQKIVNRHRKWEKWGLFRGLTEK